MSIRPSVVRLVACAALASGALSLVACSLPSENTRAARSADIPASAAPFGPANADPGWFVKEPPHRPGVWHTADPVILDTDTMPWSRPVKRANERMRNKWFVPPHQSPKEAPTAEMRAAAEGPQAGAIGEALRARPTDTSFDTLGQSGWIPPDPTLAVGPNHVVVTVNQDIAFYTRAGTLTFFNRLNNSGSPGFFEPVGGGSFTFDPKVFYDHYTDRFVVVAPEVYTDAGQAFISIAVSDDNDPNGVWFKYRTNAVFSPDGVNTFWWDYPGFGYDQDAYYVTCNLFGLNNSGFGGAGFRIYRKTEMLSGEPVVFTTLSDPNSASVQIAHHYGDNPAAYFASASGAAVRVHAITDPLGTPGLTSINVPVPNYGSPVGSPTPSGTVDSIGTRFMNAFWREGGLTATHSVRSNNRDVARWYDIDTNGWPVSGSTPTLVQAGDVPGPDTTNTFFPAIAENGRGDIGLMFGTSSASQNVGIAVTGRIALDPPNTMGPPTTVFVGPSAGNGRWGDYYDLAVDPIDDTTFWYIGQYAAPSGWVTRVGTFSVGPDDAPVASPDEAGIVEPSSPADLDVLANDFHTGGRPLTIVSFDVVSIEGGTVARLTGAGPDGRDLLRYTPPSGYIGADSFTYTIQDPLGATSTGAVTATAFDSSALRPADGLPISTAPGLTATYYEPFNGTLLPDFDTLTPSFERTIPGLNYGSTSGRFADSGLRDRFAAVFEGFITVPAPDLYTFELTVDDGAKLFIGDTLVVDADSQNTVATTTEGQIGLQAGAHRLRVEFFESVGFLALIARVGGLAQQPEVIAESALVYNDNPCPADLTFPFGELTFADISLFLTLFQLGDPAADFAQPFGAFTFADLSAFLASFAAGCP